MARNRKRNPSVPAHYSRDALGHAYSHYPQRTLTEEVVFDPDFTIFDPDVVRHFIAKSPTLARLRLMPVEERLKVDPSLTDEILADPAKLYDWYVTSAIAAREAASQWRLFDPRFDDWEESWSDLKPGEALSIIQRTGSTRYRSGVRPESTPYPYLVDPEETFWHEARPYFHESEPDEVVDSDSRQYADRGRSRLESAQSTRSQRRRIDRIRAEVYEALASGSVTLPRVVLLLQQGKDADFDSAMDSGNWLAHLAKKLGLIEKVKQIEGVDITQALDDLTDEQIIVLCFDLAVGDLEDTLSHLTQSHIIRSFAQRDIEAIASTWAFMSSDGAWPWNFSTMFAKTTLSASLISALVIYLGYRELLVGVADSSKRVQWLEEVAEVVATARDAMSTIGISRLVWGLGLTDYIDTRILLARAFPAVYRRWILGDYTIPGRGKAWDLVVERAYEIMANAPDA